MSVRPIQVTYDINRADSPSDILLVESSTIARRGGEDTAFAFAPHIRDSIRTPTPGEYSLCVANLGHTPITLRAGDILGTISPCTAAEMAGMRAVSDTETPHFPSLASRAPTQYLPRGADAYHISRDLGDGSYRLSHSRDPSQPEMSIHGDTTLLTYYTPKTPKIARRAAVMLARTNVTDEQLTRERLRDYSTPELVYDTATHVLSSSSLASAAESDAQRNARLMQYTEIDRAALAARDAAHIAE